MTVDISNNTKSSLNSLNECIEKLISNLDKEKIPKNIDLIIDGGSFNGAFACGILIYLKKLEELKLLKVDRISGCSIGAILAVVYLTDSIDENIPLFKELLTSFRETMLLDKSSDIIHKLINKYVTNIDILNDKLFITYYDVSTMKQVIVNKYESKEELIDILIRSSYIPFITDGNIQYKNKYCDGCTPYIFHKTNNKILFIYLTSKKKITRMFYTNNEVNIWPRLFTGVTDINNFFSGLQTDMCSYINDWTIADFSLMRLKDIIVVILILIIKLSVSVKDNIPENIKNNIYLSRFQKILIVLYKDIFSHFIL
jgi:hypothetical protein